MAKVIIVGDGPGGLSAALFLAKLDMDVTVFGVDKTAMHDAMLYNYLGIPEMTGSEFQKIARQQVTGFGAALQNKLVTGIEKTDSPMCPHHTRIRAVARMQHIAIGPLFPACLIALLCQVFHHTIQPCGRRCRV